MDKLDFPQKPRGLQVFSKETIVKGKPARIRCLEIDRQTYAIVAVPEPHRPGKIFEKFLDRPGKQPILVLGFWSV